jgi:ribonuclease BN (tRNA processing enzyme)
LHITIAAPGDLTTDWTPRTKPLKIYGPDKPLERIKHLMQASYLNHFNLGNVEIEEIVEDTMSDKDWTIKSYLAKHNPETQSLCFRLESGGKILAYSGDGIESDGLNQAIKEADVAVIEAGWPEEVKPKTHLTGPRTAKTAQAGAVKKLVLTHVAPYYLKNGDPLKDAQEYFKGEVLLAQDLLKIEI